jgi:hypothetical protein
LFLQSIQITKWIRRKYFLRRIWQAFLKSTVYHLWQRNGFLVPSSFSSFSISYCFSFLIFWRKIPIQLMLLVPIPFFMDSTPPSDISVIFSLIWHTPTCYKEILNSSNFQVRRNLSFFSLKKTSRFSLKEAKNNKETIDSQI